MFENLLGQGEVLAALKADVAADRLPPAILFSGPPGSGKCTAALELARIMSCATRAGALRSASTAALAPWNCACPACSRHRLLAHSDLVLIGPRSFPEEIPAALELLLRAPSPAAAYFFVRAARKLARRFDSALYEGEETRLAKAAPLLRELEESLDAIGPDKVVGALSAAASTAATKSAATAAKLEAFVPDAPPVFMIRNLEFWAHLAPIGPRKVAIIENADRMLDSSRNALLKILEEPPESVRFVLTSSRRSAIMTTILSRSRTYHFARRDAAGAALVIERVFRSSEPAPSVESFLAARRPFPPSRARELAEAFLGAALARQVAEGDDQVAPGDCDETLAPPLRALACEAELKGEALRSSTLAELLEATKDFGAKDESLASSFRDFLAALASRLGDLLREEGMDAKALDLVSSIAALVRGASIEYETLNRGPGLLAESLMYAIGATSRARRP